MIPDGMPVLSAGAHKSPQDGACVMEYVSLLAGEEWSDRPRCTHPELWGVAWWANDNLPDDERQRLLPLVPRLIGTSVWGRPRGEISAVNRGLREWKYQHYWTTAAAVPDADPVGVLTGLLDEFDRLTGRTAPAPLTDNDLARLAAATR